MAAVLPANFGPAPSGLMSALNQGADWTLLGVLAKNPDQNNSNSGVADPIPPAISELAYVTLSADLLKRYAAKPVSSRRAVRDVIVGHPVSGTADTLANSDIELVPDTTRGVLLLRVRGTINSRTVSDAGVVQIWSSGQTSFQTYKYVIVSERGLQVYPATTRAVSRSTTTGIGTRLPGLRGWFARRIATRQAGMLRAQADAESAALAQRRINRALDANINRIVGRLNRRVQALAATLPAGPGQGPHQLRCLTTASDLHLVWRRVPRGVTVTAWQPPVPERRSLAAVRLHSDLLKLALVNAQFGHALQPISDLTTGGARTRLTSLRKSSPTPRKISWSDDGNWLTLTWPAAARRAPAAVPSVSAAPVGVQSRIDRGAPLPLQQNAAATQPGRGLPCSCDLR